MTELPFVSHSEQLLHHHHRDETKFQGLSSLSILCFYKKNQEKLDTSFYYNIKTTLKQNIQIDLNKFVIEIFTVIMMSILGML